MQVNIHMRAHINTLVYVVEGEEQSLLGLRDGEALGIIKIKPEGTFTVRITVLLQK